MNYSSEANFEILKLDREALIFPFLLLLQNNDFQWFLSSEEPSKIKIKVPQTSVESSLS